MRANLDNLVTMIPFYIDKSLDGRLFKFRINTEMMWKKIYDNIEKFAFLRIKKHFFAFKHFEANWQM